ncbi:MAG: VWA domain-containing protein [Betaproteobacteria bacterium]|nr:VWA domain-containing protein [Betaproteobacteria bacterium]
MNSEVEKALAALAEASFVAHRDALAALPCVRRHGDAAALEWLKACRELFLHDRDAGRAFIRGTPAIEEVAEEVLTWTRQALQFMKWRNSWKAVEGFMDNLPRAYLILGHAGEVRWAEIGHKWCMRHLESGTAYFRTPVDDLAGRQGITGVENVCTPAEELFELRRLALSTYLAGAIKVRNLLGAPAVLPWALRGADILQAGRLRGEAYFRLESEESLHLLMEQLPGYRLPEHQRLMQFLVAAWYPGSIGLKDGNWSPDQGRAFVETDGRDLFLPAAMAGREEAVLGVLHAAGHILFGSYRRDHMEALFREAGAANPSVDPGQRIDWQPLYALFGDDAPRFQLLFDLCEDLRVDWRIGKVIPNHLQRMVEEAEACHPGPGPAADYYDLALRTLKRAANFTPALTLPHQGGGNASRRFEPLLAEQATVADAFRIALQLYREIPLAPVSTREECQRAYLPGRSPNAARPVYPREEQTESGKQQRDLDQEEGTPSQTPLPLADEKSPKCVQGGEPESDQKTDRMAGVGGQAGFGIPQPARVQSHGRGQGAGERGIPYPEWDYREGRYKRNWAWVQERKLAESNMNEAIRLTHQYAHALARLKKAIQAQKPTRQAPLKRQFEGDDIDLDAVVGFVAEKRAGLSPHTSIYRRRDVQQRDTAVTLLADLSTSVMQQLPEGQGRVVDRIRAGLLLFAESMEVVGDAYAIAGFSSKYRDSVSYYTIKDFEQPYTGEMKAVIGGLSGRLATRMGAAMRHALTRFRDAPCRRRLLLILSDGRPEDYDDGGDVRYLHEDTRMAVKEAGDQGVHAFCITLDPAGTEYLSRIFGAGHYLVLDHINSLPKKLPEIYLRLRR